jgi:predicted N-acetyltransferase YhbS
MSRLVVRPEQRGDEAEIRRVVAAAFGTPAEADLVEALRASDAWLPRLSLVAIDEGALVGHALFTRATIRTAGGLFPIVALAPVAVAPARQRQGIGGALIRAGLAEARDSGERIAIVLGHSAYYPRFGFEPAVPRGITCAFAQGEHASAFMALALQPGALEGVRGLAEYARPFGAFA